MELSAIIPTRNRAASLQRLLESLRGIEWQNGTALEVLVVDNGSTDRTAELLREEKQRETRFRLKVLQEAQKGKARAVNRGLAETKLPLIALLDDDVVVHPAWMAEHVRAHGETAFDVIQGRVLPGVDSEGRAAHLERLWEYNVPIVDYGDVMCEARGIVGNNVSFKRDVLERVGFFDIRLGPGARGFSEDTEYSNRIRKAGFKIGYSPRAVVYHELNPERYGKRYNRMIHYKRGLSRSLYRHDSIPFRVLPDLAANVLRLGAYHLARNREKIFATEARIMRYWGYVIGKLQARPGRHEGDSGR